MLKFLFIMSLILAVITFILDFIVWVDSKSSGGDT